MRNQFKRNKYSKRLLSLKRLFVVKLNPSLRSHKRKFLRLLPKSTSFLSRRSKL